MSIQNILIALLLIAVFQLPAFAQEEFADLSSKERISIAEKEESEAKKDSEFQKTMQEGHELFKQKRYLKAIRKYEKAQEKRPYNVYPKVIISDIELSMADTLATLREAERLEDFNNDKPEVIQPPKTNPNQEKKEEKKPESNTIKKLDDWEQKERERRQKEREARELENSEQRLEGANTEVKVLSVEDFQKELGLKFPNGITETTSKEGNKTIVKRIVVENGHGNEYKKVIHNWGGVFYFKNGEAVTERVWKQETEK